MELPDLAWSACANLASGPPGSRNFTEDTLTGRVNPENLLAGVTQSFTCIAYVLFSRYDSQTDVQSARRQNPTFRGPPSASRPPSLAAPGHVSEKQLPVVNTWPKYDHSHLWALSHLPLSRLRSP